MERIIKIIAEELNIKEKQVEAAVNLIDEGNTIPFIWWNIKRFRG